MKSCLEHGGRNYMKSVQEEIKKNGVTRQYISDMTIRYLTSSKFALPTKSILDEDSQIKAWIAFGACGGITYGRPRIGKTVCLNYIANSIREDYKSHESVIIWNITDHPDTEKNFYASLLMAMGYECQARKTALMLKERVLNELIIRAYETPFRRVILFIDEAWKLYEKDFSWLMDLYNNLNGQDIQLSVFMFGTQELKDLKKSFKQQRKNQIVGRFMINEIQYSGIRNKNELKFCLASMDKLHMRTTDYKQLQEKILDFYFPYAENCSFFILAEELWDAFQYVRENKGILAGDIPMKYVIDTLVICLSIYGSLSSTAVVFPTKKELIKCIELSGYEESDDEYCKK